MLTTDVEGDPVILNGFETKLSPDVNFGMMFAETGKYFAGVSVFNLLEVRTDLFQDMDNNENPIRRTFYFTGGYTFNLNEQFDLQPSTHIQYQMNAPFQAEFALRGIYNDLIGLGVSYRINDALAYMLSVDLGQLRIGYSYDMTMSNMKKSFYGITRIPCDIQDSTKECGKNFNGNEQYPNVLLEIFNDYYA